MTRAFEELYGIPDAFGRVEFSGRSDSALFLDAARAHSVPSPENEVARYVEAYVPHMNSALRETSGRLMPGIVAALAALAGRDDVVQGLGTGNFRRTGEAKLHHYGIADFFPGFVGGFGDDDERREELVRIGIERLGGAGNGSRVVVIGDTPHDVAAARANNAFALAVATGKDTVDELTAAGADVALADLADTRRVVEVILG
jgi:phosphoglycolate phosphatase-like HAD superfamily hydrolase